MNMKQSSEITQAEYRKLFVTMSLGVVFQNAEGVIIDANPAAERILGISLDQMKGLTSMDPCWKAVRVDGSDFPGDQHPIPVALRTGKEVRGVVHGIYHPGKKRTIWIEVNAIPLFRSGEEKPYQAYAIIEDITEKTDAEKLQQVLHDLAFDLNTCSDLVEGFGKVLRSVLQLEGLDCGGIYIADATDNALLLMAHDGLSADFIARVRHYPGDSPNARLAATGDIQFGSYSDIRPPNDPVREKEGLRGFGLIPIMASGKLIALLNVASHEHDFIPQTTRSGLETIAYQIGGSLRRLRSEQALRESEARLSSFINSASDSFYLLDCNLNFVEINNRGLEIIGKKREEVIGKNIDDIVPDVGQTGRRAKHLEVLRTGKPYTIEHFVPHPIFGKLHFVLKSFKVGNGLGVIAHEITERVEAEEALRESEQRLRVLSDHIPDGGVYQIDSGVDGRQRKFLYLSAGMARLHGITIEDAMNDANLIYGSIIEEDRSALVNQEAFAITKMSPFNAQARVKLPSGEIRWRMFKSAPRKLPNGHVIWDGLEMDITGLRNTEHRLNLLNRSIDVLSEAAFWFGPDNRFIYVNKAACDTLGYAEQELLSMHVWDVNPRVSPESMSKVWQYLRKNGSIIRESIHRRKDGTEVPVEIRSNYVTFGDKEYCCGFAIDITKRKQTEEALANAQKLESLGMLAGGIAHDFNNLLGGIFGYIDMAAESSSDKTVSNYLAKAIGTIDRARGLTQQLLTFAKGGAPIRNLEHLSQFIIDTARFALSGARVSCDFTIAEDLWPCEIDRNQIGQVIDNIIINAQQAMPEGGEISVSAENVTIKEQAHPTLAAGSYVKISFIDQGIGMPKEMLHKIFDPFYTTKPKGHGLGLATCYSIINRHGGCIDVESEPGKGSVFHVFIPALPGASSATIHKAKGTHRGSGAVLIMDDEEVIRDITAEMLKSLGYKVICARNGSEAIDAYMAEKNAKRAIAAMIFDLTIPGGMGGKEAIGKIRDLDKNIPVFVASGYADDPVMANPVEFGFTASICKPFRKTELAEVLEKHLTVKK
jgi:PAS domain S-box-containing protein